MTTKLVAWNNRDISYQDVFSHGSEAGSLHSRSQQDWFLWKVPGEHLFLVSSSFKLLSHPLACGHITPICTSIFFFFWYLYFHTAFSSLCGIYSDSLFKDTCGGIWGPLGYQGKPYISRSLINHTCTNLII